MIFFYYGSTFSIIPMIYDCRILSLRLYIDKVERAPNAFGKRPNWGGIKINRAFFNRLKYCGSFLIDDNRCCKDFWCMHSRATSWVMSVGRSKRESTNFTRVSRLLIDLWQIDFAGWWFKIWGSIELSGECWKTSTASFIAKGKIVRKRIPSLALTDWIDLDWYFEIIVCLP